MWPRLGGWGGDAAPEASSAKPCGSPLPGVLRSAGAGMEVGARAAADVPADVRWFGGRKAVCTVGDLSLSTVGHRQGASPGPPPPPKSQRPASSPACLSAPTGTRACKSTCSACTPRSWPRWRCARWGATSTSLTPLAGSLPASPALAACLDSPGPPALRNRW